MIEHIEEGQGGLLTREKLNSVIDRANYVDAIRDGQLAAQNRPGEALVFFTEVLSGEAGDIPQIGIGSIVTTDRGLALRIPVPGAPVNIVQRPAQRVDAGQVYVAQFAAQRSSNTPDPFGDAVEFRLACLDKDKTFISSFLVQRRALTVADGRYAASVTFSLDQAADQTLTASTRYVRPYVRLYGAGGVTDIELLGVASPNNGLPGPKGDKGDEPEHVYDEPNELLNFRQPDGSLGPTIDIGSARKKAEEARDIAQGFASDIVSQGNVPIYATQDGIAALVMPAFTAIRTNGKANARDGKSATLARSVSEPTHYGKVQSADGAWWEEVSREISHDVLRGVMSLTPAVNAEIADPKSNPGGNHYFNQIFAAGGSRLTDVSKRIFRSTAFGQAIGEDAEDWGRVEAFGSGAMRFARLVDRSTGIGSLSLCWSGTDDPLGNYHDFWPNGDGATVNPGQPGWDAYGLETRNPGSGAQIAATSLSTTPDQNTGNVGIGRNSLLHQVIGSNNTAGGYNSQAHAWSGSFNTTFGYSAGRDNLFASTLTAIGAETGEEHQTGDKDTFVGATAAKELRRGGFNTIIGAYSARNVTDAQRVVILGHEAGQGLGTVLADILAIQNAVTRNPLIAGNFVLRGSAVHGIGVNIKPDDIRAMLHVRQGDSGIGAPVATARGIMLEDAGSTGITVATPATSLGRLYFARPGVVEAGGISYNHSSNVLAFRANNAFRMQIDGTGIGFNGNTPFAKPTGVAVTVAAIHAALVSYGLIAA